MVKKVLVNATYGNVFSEAYSYQHSWKFTFAGYIEKLMSKTINLCEDNNDHTITEATPQPLCAAYEHPPKARAIEEHKSRFNK